MSRLTPQVPETASRRLQMYTKFSLGMIFSRFFYAYSDQALYQLMLPESYLLTVCQEN